MGKEAHVIISLLAIVLVMVLFFKWIGWEGESVHYQQHPTVPGVF